MNIGVKRFWQLFLSCGAIFLFLAAWGLAKSPGPEEVLKEAARAFLERDEMTFVRYVDTARLIESAYDEGAFELAQNIAALRNRYPEDFFFHHDTAFMLNYTKEHREKALRLINGAKSAYFTAQPPAATLEENPPAWLAGEMAKFTAAAQGELVAVNTDGDRAVAEVRTKGDDTDYGQMADGLTFKLELVADSETGWKIVKITNVSELLFPITDSAERFWTVQGWQ